MKQFLKEFNQVIDQHSERIVAVDLQLVKETENLAALEKESARLFVSGEDVEGVEREIIAKKNTLDRLTRHLKALEDAPMHEQLQPIAENVCTKADEMLTELNTRWNKAKVNIEKARTDYLNSLKQARQIHCEVEEVYLKAKEVKQYAHPKVQSATVEIEHAAFQNNIAVKATDCILILLGHPPQFRQKTVKTYAKYNDGR